MSDLEQEFRTKVVATNVDATTAENRRAVQDLGFRNHGLVIRSAQGDVLWKQPDHEVEIAALRKALEQLVHARR